MICVIQEKAVPFLSSHRSERSAPKETVHSAREQRYFAFGTWIAMADTAPLNQRATKASALPIRA